MAVIALIASPIIMGVIGKTKKQAFERSIDGILDAVRLDYSSDGFVSPREYFYEGNNLILLTVNEETLDKSVGIKGKINGKGFIYIDSEGTIHVENVCNKDYCANGTEPNVEITENATGEIPELSKNDPMIKIKGDKTVYVNIGEPYTELGATAKTMSGQVLEYTTEITLNGEVVTNIDTANENTYVITYKTEHEGKTVTDTRNVVILDMKPVITITEGKETYVKEQEILISVSAVRPNTITSFTVEIKKDGEVIETETVNGISKTIMLNETGNYEVIVTVTDNHEHTNTITKTYKIDSEPPVIEFTSEITLKANEVSGFVFENDKTVKVSDNTNLVTWKTEGNLNSTIIGAQEITYIATDEAGNETREIRTFHIDEADGPVLNYSSASSDNIWIKATTITLYAEIRVENDELTAFTYQVDDGEIVNVPITNNKQMEVSVDLNTTGRHNIKITATGKHGNTKEETIGEFLIDVTAPTVENISGNTDDWTTSKTLTSSITDNDSKIKYYAFIKDNATKPAEDSADWKEVTAISPYNFSQSVTANGTYYLWAKDSAGNISASKSVIVSKIDDKAPTLTVTNYNGKYGANIAIETLYNKDIFGGMGGNVVCKDGTTRISNIKDITLADDHTIKCTATPNNGKTSVEKTISLNFESKTFTEIMNASSEVANNDPDKNLRYVGASPSNYVMLNGEKWRIIGLFNGQPKLILGANFYGSGNMAWATNGSNNWANASAMNELNNIYFSNINETSKRYIDGTYKWKLGSVSSVSLNRETFYNQEKAGTVWPGAIGLPNPSDYAYATNGGNICGTTALSNWSGQSEECPQKSWLVSTAWVTYWTLVSLTGDGTQALYYHYNGNTTALSVAHGEYGGPTLRPVLYLKSNVKIKGGTGTSSDPYILGT